MLTDTPGSGFPSGSRTLPESFASNSDEPMPLGWGAWTGSSQACIRGSGSDQSMVWAKASAGPMDSSSEAVRIRDNNLLIIGYTSIFGNLRLYIFAILAIILSILRRVNI